MVVILPEMWLDVFPDVLEVNEVELESKFILSWDHLVANCVGICADVEFFISGVDVYNEAFAEAALALWG